MIGITNLHVDKLKTAARCFFAVQTRRTDRAARCGKTNQRRRQLHSSQHHSHLAAVGCCYKPRRQKLTRPICTVHRNESSSLFSVCSIMKEFSGSNIFHYTWQQIAQAFWRKYPNKYANHVLSEDTIGRVVDEDGLLRTRRLLVKTNKAPRWVEKLMGTKKVCILEESVVNPLEKTLTTITRNLGLSYLMSVEETCVYKPHPENNVWTIVERKATFNSKITGFARLALERYKFNTRKADIGFEQVLKNVQTN